ncbi:flagellar hook-associated protein 2 [Motilibacter rhizosphaerae]|uniref:Flagellar hook-associated protein 2 n=1 Tax=Motilibacter rhizosphaerae TaxID=598652 RepID=A0A4V2F532_9ACTN|nr:flagellar filament capping protein FliD [Motilibacter rhizosphaerae]RZS91409.1 flagellar hook-associated protein 2 [Motilibacter rhizosphaerae]
MSSSVDGLVSGLDTSGLINQLMQVESATQTRLKTRVTTEQKAVSAYQSVNTAMTSLLTASKAMSSDTSLSVFKSTSDSDNVTASADATAYEGSFSFTVKQSAKNEVQLSAQSFTDLSAAATTGPVKVVFGSDPTATPKATLTPRDSSLGALVDAINQSPDLGVRAAAIRTSDGTYRLQVQSSATGAASQFSLSGLTQTMNRSQPAQDAQITLAGDATAVVSSPTNTFTNVVPGLTFTVKPGTTAGTNVTVSTARDTSGIADNMQKMIDAANSAMNQIKTQTAYNTSTNTGSALTGDFTVRQLQQQILSAISSSSTNGLTASDIGIKSDQTGTISFDRTKFLDTLAKNPAGVKQMLGVSATSSTPGISLGGSNERTLPGTYAVTYNPPAGGSTDATGSVTVNGTSVAVRGSGSSLTVTDLGSPASGLVVKGGLTAASGTLTVSGGLAQRLANLAQTATDSTSGTITQAITGRNSNIKDLNDQISAWDTELALKKTSLQSQYSGLEVSLGKLKDQSTWLAGQLAGLR